MIVIARRPAWLAWLCLAAIVTVVAVSAVAVVQAVTTQGPIKVLGQTDRPGLMLIALVICAMLAPAAAIALLRSLQTLIRHGSAVIWIADGNIHSATTKAVPLEQVLHVGTARGLSGMRLVELNLKSGKNVRMGVGWMRPDPRGAADSIRKHLEPSR